MCTAWNIYIILWSTRLHSYTIHTQIGVHFQKTLKLMTSTFHPWRNASEKYCSTIVDGGWRKSNKMKNKDDCSTIISHILSGWINSRAWWKWEEWAKERKNKLTLRCREWILNTEQTLFYATWKLCFRRTRNQKIWQ